MPDGHVARHGHRPALADGLKPKKLGGHADANEIVREVNRHPDSSVFGDGVMHDQDSEPRRHVAFVLWSVHDRSVTDASV